MKKITRIYIESVGYKHSVDGEITEFTVNGEMAPVKWFRQGNKEWNGKYVIEVEYE